jgi:hypothetical protein
MALNPYTNQFMKALPPKLRPNPWTAEEYVLRAIENGWTAEQLAEMSYVNEKTNATPGFIIQNIKSLCLYPPQQKALKPRYSGGHEACTEHGHDRGCIICKCVPGQVQHIVPTPMPRDLFADYLPLGEMP